MSIVLVNVHLCLVSAYAGMAERILERRRHGDVHRNAVPIVYWSYVPGSIRVIFFPRIVIVRVVFSFTRTENIAKWEIF